MIGKSCFKALTFSLLLFWLILTPCKAQAGSLVDPNTYAKLKALAQDYFGQLQSEIANEGVSPEDGEKIIFNYVKELDGQLQGKLQAGALNEDNFKEVMFEVNIGLILKPGYEPLLKATLRILGFEGENPFQVFQEIITGKRPLPAGIQQFYEAVKQEVLYDALSKPALPAPSGGGDGSAVMPAENKNLTGKEEEKAAAPAKSPEKALTFTDIENHWAGESIYMLVNQGVIGGYPDHTFRPDNQITRAEFIKILVKAMSLAEENLQSPSFIDVPKLSWAYGAVEAAARAGLVKGSEGKFRPHDPITRQEMAVMLVRALDNGVDVSNTLPAFSDDVKIAPWARGHVAAALNQDLIKGYPDNTFRPQKNASRAEAVLMTCRFLNQKQFKQKEKWFN